MKSSFCLCISQMFYRMAYLTTHLSILFYYILGTQLKLQNLYTYTFIYLYLCSLFSFYLYNYSSPYNKFHTNTIKQLCYYYYLSHGLGMTSAIQCSLVQCGGLKFSEGLPHSHLSST